jgi:hypothetical protein
MTGVGMPQLYGRDITTGDLAQGTVRVFKITVLSPDVFKEHYAWIGTFLSLAFQLLTSVRFGDGRNLCK